MTLIIQPDIEDRMKRSTINAEINRAKQLFDSIGFKLPPFAFWSPEVFLQRQDSIREIIDNRLGWDVTDYGCGSFDDRGLLLFTIRNGNPKRSEPYAKTYAEKLMVSKEGQVAPMHFHFRKKEDIINRGGGQLVMQLYLSTTDGELSDLPFDVSVDGVRTRIEPGRNLVLSPGQSVFLPPLLYHRFYARNGDVVIGEISEVNDDEHDNRFLKSIGRFPDIEEDEAPLHLMCTDYESWMG